MNKESRFSKEAEFVAALFIAGVASVAAEETVWPGAFSIYAQLILFLGAGLPLYMWGKDVGEDTSGK